MSLMSVVRKVGAGAVGLTPALKNTDLKTVHSKSILGRIMGKEHDPDADGLIKSTLKGMMGGLYEDASDKSLIGRIRNRNNEEEDDNSDTDDDSSNTRPVLASVVDTARRVSSPTISGISRQLQDVVNRVMSMGKQLKKQQDMMVDQSRQQEHINKENIMEAGKHLLPNAANDDASLTSAFKALSERIAEVTEELEEGGGGGLLNNILSRFGFGGKAGKLEAGAAKAIKLKKGFAAVETAAGTRFRNASTGRFVKAAEAIKKPGVIGKLTSKVGSVLSGASKLAAGSKVGRMVGELTPLAIKKLAMPLAVKAVGKTVLKSIPIIGAIAGIGFAAKRLMEGDVVGAGLDAVSGLGGPLTAIPALILSLARDLYEQAFGVSPEADPLVGKRMGIVKDGVKMAVEAAITPAIKPQQSAAGDNQKALQLPTIKKPANDNQVSKPPAVPAMAPAKIPQAKPANQSSPPAPATTKAPPAKPAAKPAAVSTPAPKPTPAKPTASTGLGAVPSLASAAVGTGKSIAAASMMNDTLTMPPPPSLMADNTPSVLPAKSPTTNPASQGIGNVPDPTYFDIDMFAKQMYFGAAA